MNPKALLISIHPCYVESILIGKKVFEYRKFRPKKNVSHLVFYATSPTKQIVAMAELTGCISDIPEMVWEKTRDKSGISSQFFLNYFSDRSKAHALCIGLVTRLQAPLDISTLSDIVSAPQSFCYLSPSDWEFLQKHI